MLFRSQTEFANSINLGDDLVFYQVWAMDLSLILPDQFQLTQQQVGETTIYFGLVATQTNGRCPACQRTANKVHSFYQRTLADLPICGRSVSLRIHLRKFVCGNDQCPRKIFAQTAPAYFPPYARRLNRAQHPMQVMALQTGARPAARLCALIGQPVSHSTLLRISRKAPVELHPGPKRVGVDDLPVRRSDSERDDDTGRLLRSDASVDLDKRQPIDLLPDREGKTLEAWFRDHGSGQPSWR